MDSAFERTAFLISVSPDLMTSTYFVGEKRRALFIVYFSLMRMNVYPEDIKRCFIASSQLYPAQYAIGQDTGMINKKYPLIILF